METLLESFAKRVNECDGNQLKIHAICTEQATILANVINAQTAASLVSFLLILKKEIPGTIEKALVDSGNAVIESFKNNHMSNKER